MSGINYKIKVFDWSKKASLTQKGENLPMLKEKCIYELEYIH